MIQSESLDLGCVCPECLYRCRACMGTNTVVSREDLHRLTFIDRTADEDMESLQSMEETGGERPEPLRPEDLID